MAVVNFCGKRNRCAQRIRAVGATVKMSMTLPPRPNSTDFSGKRQFHFTFHTKGNRTRTATITDAQGGTHRLLLFEAPMSVKDATKAMAGEKAEAAQAVTASQLTFEVCSGGSTVLAGRGGGEEAMSYLFDNSTLLQSLSSDEHDRKDCGYIRLQSGQLSSSKRAIPRVPAKRARSLSPSTSSAQSRMVKITPDINTERGRGQLRAQRSNDVIILRYRPLSARENELQKSMSRMPDLRCTVTPAEDWTFKFGADVIAPVQSPPDESRRNEALFRAAISPCKASSDSSAMPTYTDAVTVKPADVMSVPTRSQKCNCISIVFRDRNLSVCSVLT